MNYCVMCYFWSKELATILSKLLMITVVFYVNFVVLEHKHKISNC